MATAQLVHWFIHLCLVMCELGCELNYGNASQLVQHGGVLLPHTFRAVGLNPLAVLYVEGVVLLMLWRSRLGSPPAVQSDEVRRL